jgi:hypothetical protein
MNQFILNVIIVYTIASIIYLLSLFLLKSNKITDILNEEQMEEYSKIRKQKIMVFIIGIVIGLCFIILFDNFFNKEAISKATISVKNIVEDVSDISVI